MYHDLIRHNIIPYRTHTDEASAKNVGNSYQVQTDVGQTSWEQLIKHLQSLAEQEAMFIAEIK